MQPQRFRRGERVVEMKLEFQSVCDHVRLARRAANDFGAESRNVKPTGEARGHLHVATGESEVERPKRIGASPRQETLQ